ncbi:GNAT family N-acetyltransferase [Fluoribacter dumoffii]|uniref:GNAT family N-acetyltransferase n=1 Tax=Fluoribacter dumoffii TaxID=463 RepID=UPI002243E191|nr:GNAT family N-acetyltransferase [Fluoribacter dumoffii]MCW8418685.1 GNAT family N-acetyltransferase [Fluoribacter dumoffii]MCW8453471.1 GNAT family N-acetyltransferase [Fluoribacter dumoffii]MCW8459309.1 GNAT family N-acetyltransferase [Fluoribacter dumoffii]MCW8482668.1 GNAT family N-acetyltransferase [Fluoribacter dumoffii]
MNEQVKIVTDFKENEIISKIIYENLKKFNESIIGKYEAKPFVIYAKNDESEVFGGIKGDLFGSMCRVFTVWIHERYRGKGLGRRLFEKLDVFAKENHCNMIQLDTAEFQAKGFYEKMGYQVVATLPENFMGYTSYILRKKLIPDGTFLNLGQQ